MGGIGDSLCRVPRFFGVGSEQPGGGSALTTAGESTEFAAAGRAQPGPPSQGPASTWPVSEPWALQALRIAVRL